MEKAERLLYMRDVLGDGFCGINAIAIILLSSLQLKTEYARELVREDIVSSKEFIADIVNSIRYLNHSQYDNQLPDPILIKDLDSLTDYFRAPFFMETDHDREAQHIFRVGLLRLLQAPTLEYRDLLASSVNRFYTIMLDDQESNKLPSELKQECIKIILGFLPETTEKQLTPAVYAIGQRYRDFLLSKNQVEQLEVEFPPEDQVSDLEKAYSFIWEQFLQAWKEDLKEYPFESPQQQSNRHTCFANSLYKIYCAMYEEQANVLGTNPCLVNHVDVIEKTFHIRERLFCGDQMGYTGVALSLTEMNEIQCISLSDDRVMSAAHAFWAQSVNSFDHAITSQSKKPLSVYKGCGMKYWASIEELRKLQRMLFQKKAWSTISVETHRGSIEALQSEGVIATVQNLGGAHFTVGINPECAHHPLETAFLANLMQQSEPHPENSSSIFQKMLSSSLAQKTGATFLKNNHDEEEIEGLDWVEIIVLTVIAIIALALLSWILYSAACIAGSFISAYIIHPLASAWSVISSSCVQCYQAIRSGISYVLRSLSTTATASETVVANTSSALNTTTNAIYDALIYTQPYLPSMRVPSSLTISKDSLSLSALSIYKTMKAS